MSACDILVIGLGPAGASAAAAAARAGARVLAVDRRARPGVPVQCAEFVPGLLASDTSAVGAALVQGIGAMETYLPGGQHLTPDFRGVMIDRAAFDAALVAEAQMAGARVESGTALLGIDAGQALLVDGEVVTPRVVIGADGPRSVVGRLAGMGNAAIVETRQVTVPLSAAHKATDIFLSPEIEGGYGWLFPRGAEANVGLGVVPEAKAQLKPLLADLLARLRGEGRIGAGEQRLTGGAIPVGGICGLAGRIGALPVLLAGDAAGLANPITGAGISAAVQSGRLAGAAAARIAAGQAEAGQDYAEEVSDLFGPSIDLALKRRAEILGVYARGLKPGTGDLRRSWIAFDDYWHRATLPMETLT